MRKADLYIKLTQLNIKYSKKMNKKSLLNLLHTSVEEVDLEIKINSDNSIVDSEPYNDNSIVDNDNSIVDNDNSIVESEPEPAVKTHDHDFKIQYLQNRIIYIKGDLQQIYKKELSRLLKME